MGYVAYEVGAQKGWKFFVYTGAFVGGISMLAVLAFTPYVGTLSVREMEITVPTFGKVKFAPIEGEREAAWKLFIESATRVSTQRLEPNAGSLREALSSLYTLFTKTREILKNLDPKCVQHLPNVMSVDIAATAMLNQHLRPFLSKWHPLLTEFERANSGKHESEWEHNQECREALEGVRKDLVLYVRALGSVAGISHLDEIVPPES